MQLQVQMMSMECTFDVADDTEYKELKLGADDVLDWRRRWWNWRVLIDVSDGKDGKELELGTADVLCADLNAGPGGIEDADDELGQK